MAATRWSAIFCFSRVEVPFLVDPPEVAADGVEHGGGVFHPGGRGDVQVGGHDAVAVHGQEVLELVDPVAGSRQPSRSLWMICADVVSSDDLLGRARRTPAWPGSTVPRRCWVAMLSKPRSMTIMSFSSTPCSLQKPSNAKYTASAGYMRLKWISQLRRLSTSARSDASAGGPGSACQCRHRSACPGCAVPRRSGSCSTPPSCRCSTPPVARTSAARAPISAGSEIRAKPR